MSNFIKSLIFLEKNESCDNGKLRVMPHFLLNIKNADHKGKTDVRNRQLLVIRCCDWPPDTKLHLVVLRYLIFSKRLY